MLNHNAIPPARGFPGISLTRTVLSIDLHDITRGSPTARCQVDDSNELLKVLLLDNRFFEVRGCATSELVGLFFGHALVGGDVVAHEGCLLGASA